MGHRLDADVQIDFRSYSLGVYVVDHIFKGGAVKAIRSAIVGIIGLVIAATAVPAFAAETTPPGIGVREANLGTFFTTADGLSLYIYDNDKAAGKSTCVDKCAVTWPPLIAPPDARPVGLWSITDRPDGTKQWAFDGSPVYKYQKDTMPRVAFGEGTLEVWHLAAKLAPRPREVTYHGALMGRVAADLRGITLYSSDKDTASSQACVTSCLRTWVPLKAPEATLAVGDWAPIQRADDGTRQWAYKGKPVYRYANDNIAGDTTGEGVDKVWHAVVMEAFPPAPSWVTLQSSEYGQIFADPQGKSLYYLTVDLAQWEHLNCPDACFRANFLPVLATADAVAPGGSWTIIANPDGKMQWAYRGELIYTFVKDTTPGDIRGQKFGVGTAGGTWQVLQQARMIPPVM